MSITSDGVQAAVKDLYNGLDPSQVTPQGNYKYTTGTSSKTLYPPTPVLPVVDLSDPEVRAEVASCIENVVQDAMPFCEGECCSGMNVGDAVREAALTIVDELFGTTSVLNFVSGDEHKRVVDELRAEIANLRFEKAQLAEDDRMKKFKSRTYPYQEQVLGRLSQERKTPKHYKVTTSSTSTANRHDPS